MSNPYLEIDEVARLEKAATNLRDRLLIRILFYLGCRISEALALEANDIDSAQGTVTIQRLKSRIKLSCPQCGAPLGKSHTFCPKCGVKVEEAVAKEHEHRRVRILPLDGDTLEMLKDYVKRGGPVTRDGKNSYLASTVTERGRLLRSVLNERAYQNWLTQKLARHTT